MGLSRMSIGTIGPSSPKQRRGGPDGTSRHPFLGTQQGTERYSSGVAVAYFFGRDSGGTKPATR
jgi:hypothetical protein